MLILSHKLLAAGDVVRVVYMIVFSSFQPVRLGLSTLKCSNAGLESNGFINATLVNDILADTECINLMLLVEHSVSVSLLVLTDLMAPISGRFVPGANFIVTEPPPDLRSPRHADLWRGLAE